MKAYPVSLDLSAAFDTIDHSILLNRLENLFGISGIPLKYLSSYITGRSQYVKIGPNQSPTELCDFGVPQASVLSPFLFTIYMSPVASVTSPFFDNNNNTLMTLRSISLCLRPIHPPVLKVSNLLCLLCYRGLPTVCYHSTRINLRLFYLAPIVAIEL